jgi:membrane protease YdiL (CAAX protease family)
MFGDFEFGADHGVCWLFATFSLFVAVPGALLLAFVAQKSRSTWPGIFGHAVMNYGLPVALVTRVLER